MNLSLDFTNKQFVNNKIIISGSKSESNRLLILQQWFPNLVLKNLSDSDDTNHLIDALKSTSEIVDIGHAGTAMRFLTAYFSVVEGRGVILTGSERMQNRPIKILVKALQSLGADISYLDKEGYPPLKIIGKEITIDKVSIKGNVSSQYISALLLIASSLKNGLIIELIGEVTSRPYLEMTLDLLNQLGVKVEWKESIIKVLPKEQITNKTITVESDWSSASYYYSLIALGNIGDTVELFSFNKKSLQGDSCLAAIYKELGIETVFRDNAIILKKIRDISKTTNINLDLKSTPDIAQTIAVTCFGLGIACNLAGLHTLKIKETDRLVALQNELQKFGAEISITDKSLYLKASSILHKNVLVKTYNDHRMAMAFAPLAIKTPISIEDAEVVTKSYINFWEDFERCFK